MNTHARTLPGHNAAQAFDVERIRQDFPILAREVYGKPLVFLDSAASAQKPRQVMAAMQEMAEAHYANVHRGLHRLSQEATDRFEAARKRVAQFLNARSEGEIVFTRSATEAINLVAQSWGVKHLKAGDEVILSELEHHANIVPWTMLRERIGIVLKVVPIDERGAFRFDAFETLLSAKTKLVAVTHTSNALGTVVPIERVIEAAHARGAAVLVDGCQAAPHRKVDVQALDADFLVFAPHKIYGPTGIGILYGKAERLASMPPWQGGGEMIAHVSFDEVTYKEAPLRFEAGTPPILESVALAAAIDYVEAIGHEAIGAHESALLAYATERLSAIEGVRILGTAPEKASILSFVMDGAHAHDVGTLLDRQGIAVRVGHHCAQPLMGVLGVPATARASFGLYNTLAEVDALAAGVEKAREFFR
jgi:cysteine desulfurase/selenocysteine lyase